MTKPAFSREVREQMAGWRLLTAYQVPQNDGRKLTRCAIPSDPWRVTLHNGSSILTATRHLSGYADTLDGAALDALSKLGAGESLIGAVESYSAAGESLLGAIGRYGEAVDGLIGAIRQ